MEARNVLYLLYFILKTNYKDLRSSLDCCINNGFSRFYLISDMFFCSLRYGSSFVDYFNFRFYEKNHSLRNRYATMAYMYRFHKKLNNQQCLDRIDNKIKFRQYFKNDCNESQVFSNSFPQNAENWFQTKVNRFVVVKNPYGTGGKEIRIKKIIESDGLFFVDETELSKFIINLFEEHDQIYVEDYINQHPEINDISPSGVNTLRIITLIDEYNKALIIGSIFRISVNRSVDNYSVGNLAAEIDPTSGVVITGGIKKNSACDEYHKFHPITKKPILGFKIPFWKEIVSLVENAAMVIPEIRTVGWDVAVTKNGPLLIEGNSKWNKDTWQIPAGRGKKYLISNYMK